MKFRASYTVLSTWARGDWERAVKQYFKLEDFTTPAMAMGKSYHEDWAKETKKTKRLPKVFGGKKLKNPKPEIKLVVPVEPWLNLVGVIDCYDEPTIYEYKTGKQSSEKYASSVQTGLYGVLSTLSNMYADRAEIWHYDQHSKKTDMSIVWLTDEAIKSAYDWLITYASEMHDYFTENKLYERFKR